MRNVSDKIYRENESTYFLINKYLPKMLPLKRKCIKNCTGRQATNDNTTRRMRIACWMPKATNTHSKYVILMAFPLRQWLQERASLFVSLVSIHLRISLSVYMTVTVHPTANMNTGSTHVQANVLP